MAILPNPLDVHAMKIAMSVSPKSAESMDMFDVQGPFCVMSRDHFENYYFELVIDTNEDSRCWFSYGFVIDINSDTPISDGQKLLSE